MNQNGDNYYHGVDEDNTAAMSIYEFEENDQDYQFCNVNRKKSKTTNLGSTIKNPYEIKKQQKQQGHKKRNVPTIKTVNNNNKRRTENKTDQPQERSNHPNFKDTDSTQQQQQQQMDLLEILPQAITFHTRVLLTFEGESVGTLFVEYGTNFLRLCDKRGLSPNIVYSTSVEGNNQKMDPKKPITRQKEIF